MRAGQHCSPSFYAAAAELVRRRTGLVFSAPRRAAFEAALSRTMRAAGCREPQSYLTRLDFEPDLLDAVVAEVTVGESYFFRDLDQLALVRDRLLPELIAGIPPPARLRIWSAGCARGEEPYTLAIVMHELGLGGAAQILATDLSRAALARAKRARYGRWSLRGVSPEIVQRFFEPVGDEYQLAAVVRDAVEFRCLNLAEDSYPSLATGIWGMDLILCRNVLIYFDPDTVARVVRRLVRALAPNGWLLLGASDPLIADLAPVEPVITDAGLAYRARPNAPCPEVSDVARGVSEPPGIAALAKPASLHRPPSVPPPPPLPAPVEPELGAEAARAYAAAEYERAAELAGRRVRQEDAPVTDWVVLVRALANRGDLAAADRACIAGLERRPMSAELLYIHGVLLGEAGRHRDAVAALRRALYLDRELAVAHLALGAELVRIGDGTAARRAFRSAVRCLVEIPPEMPVPASDGEPAGRLIEMARAQLELLGEAAA